jgi:hypothetical protein
MSTSFIALAILVAVLILPMNAVIVVMSGIDFSYVLIKSPSS